MDTDPLVGDYLSRLDAAAWMLPPDRRRELGEEVREHIVAALAAAGNRDEATIRNVLDRLGPPGEIIAAEVSPGGQSAPMPAQALIDPGVGRPGFGGLEIVALLLLTVGAILLPFVGPLIGLVFVWMSSYWTRNQKLIATLIVAFLLVVTIIGLAVGSSNALPPSVSPAM